MSFNAAEKKIICIHVCGLAIALLMNYFLKILGRDFSGVVLDVGRKVSHVEVGDTVWSAQPLASNGTLSEFLVINADSVRLKPAHLGHDGAATLPFSSLMVWDALVNQARIKPNHGLRNKKILIVDAGSPTGCIAIQV